MTTPGAPKPDDRPDDGHSYDPGNSYDSGSTHSASGDGDSSGYQPWASQQPNAQQWGGPQAYGQPAGGQQWGGQLGQPQQQWGGQPQYGQPMGGQQWGGQPNYGQPMGAPQWGGQPGQPQQQWGQPGPQQWNQGAPAAPATPRAPRNLPEWPTWVYAFQLLITFIASFLSVANVGGDLFGYGSFHVGLNWWGRFDLQSSGYGKFADNFVTQGLLEELNAEAGSGFMVFTTLLLLVLYGVAVYFGVVKKWKLASILGIAAGAIQLLAVIIAAIAARQNEEDVIVKLGAGWWLWLLISLVTLALSIALLVMGKDKLEAQVNKARASAAANQGQNDAAGAPVNQAPFNPAAPQQSPNPWQQPNQQNAGGWNQQWPGSGSTSWTQTNQQDKGSNDWARPESDYESDEPSGFTDPEKNQ
ncbi:hypothetical protein CGLAUT_08580 [Corynebacterium glaucum]|uniref:hypothetical protein n=1 Tax=Corynebacterium glaucum TaxID=187491 RepID=UPI0033864D42|nr:hypothetical protein CGLAUT_08580 [Corynebacterium glaucum]